MKYINEELYNLVRNNLNICLSNKNIFDVKGRLYMELKIYLMKYIMQLLID